jgi:hypothetical protein
VRTCIRWDEVVVLLGRQAAPQDVWHDLKLYSVVVVSIERLERVSPKSKVSRLMSCIVVG